MLQWMIGHTRQGRIRNEEKVGITLLLKRWLNLALGGLGMCGEDL